MSHWNHIIFVPGPYDYGGGTGELGDVFLSKLVAWSARDRPHITMFCSSSMDGDCGEDVVTRCIYFTGPAVLVVGAPCWPVDREAYDNARVYQRQEPWQSDKEAVMEGQIMGEERAAFRLAGDLAQIRAILDKDHSKRHASSSPTAAQAQSMQRIVASLPLQRASVWEHAPTTNTTRSVSITGSTVHQPRTPSTPWATLRVATTCTKLGCVALHTHDLSASMLQHFLL